jgi:hypothetical protein
MAKAFRGRLCVASTSGTKFLASKEQKWGLRFPKWQVTSNGGLPPELPKLFDLLGGDSWTVHRFLTRNRLELEGDTALSALQHGKVSKVRWLLINASRRLPKIPNFTR